MNDLLLTRVIYDLFESDIASLDEPESETAHTIDRQIRLEFSDSSIRHLSWSSDPVQYCIGVQEQPFFVSGDNVTRDFSAHPLWRSVVGHVLDLVVIDPDHQVVEVRSCVGLCISFIPRTRSLVGGRCHRLEH